MRTGPLADTGGRSCTAILYCTPGFDNRYYLRRSGLALLLGGSGLTSSTRQAWVGL
jgi:hypothetical protein